MDVIRTHNLTKTYRIGVGRARVREMLPWPFDRAVRAVFPGWWTRNTFNALTEINIGIEAGSAVGLVGHNGAGKTTFLKVTSGVTEPSAGRVEVNGRVAALIDLMVGFHPDLTGRENIYLLGSFHGYSRREMAKRLDRVLAFAEIDELADTPLKRYSAGMAARLGFGVITALDVDVLMVDEVLAVGDASFQRKCVEWLDGYHKRGGALLFVSHNLGLVRSMTERAIWLENGRVVDDGETDPILRDYARAMERRVDADTPQAAKRSVHRQMKSRGQRRWGAGGARVREVHIEDQRSAEDPIEFAITYEADALNEGIFAVGLIDENGQNVGATASPLLALPGDGEPVRCSISPALRPGIYFPVVAILSADGTIRDRWQLDRAIVVERNGLPATIEDFGPVEISAAWDETNARPRAGTDRA